VKLIHGITTSKCVVVFNNKYCVILSDIVNCLKKINNINVFLPLSFRFYKLCNYITMTGILTDTVNADTMVFNKQREK